MDHSGGDQDSEASHHLTESHAAPSDAGGEDLTGELTVVQGTAAILVVKIVKSVQILW